MKATQIDPEKAAAMLGIDVFDLGRNLRESAAQALQDAADRVRRGHDLDGIERAERILEAAEACEVLMLRAIEAEEDDEG